MLLSQPYNLFDLADGESRDLVVSKWDEGEVTITLTNPPRKVTVAAMRVWPTPEEPILSPGYYDITSKTLAAYIRRWLIQSPNLARRFSITAVGVGAKKRYQVSVR